MKTSRIRKVFPLLKAFSHLTFARRVHGHHLLRVVWQEFLWRSPYSTQVSRVRQLKSYVNPFRESAYQIAASGLRAQIIARSFVFLARAKLVLADMTYFTPSH
jgi:hypothetical protein